MEGTKLPPARCEPSERSVVERAATLEGVTLAAFIRLAAVDRAKRKIQEVFGNT